MLPCSKSRKKVSGRSQCTRRLTLVSQCAKEMNCFTSLNDVNMHWCLVERRYLRALIHALSTSRVMKFQNGKASRRLGLMAPFALSFEWRFACHVSLRI